MSLVLDIGGGYSGLYNVVFEKRGGVMDWVKCSDRMPGNDDFVLVSYLQGLMDFAFWDEESKGQWCGNGGKTFPKITHWMKLPEQPEEE